MFSLVFCTSIGTSLVSNLHFRAHIGHRRTTRRGTSVEKVHIGFGVTTIIGIGGRIHGSIGTTGEIRRRNRFRGSHHGNRR